MKKRITILLSLSLVTAMLTSCGLPFGKDDETEPETAEQVSGQEEDAADGIEIPPSDGPGFKAGEETGDDRNAEQEVSDPQVIVRQKFYYEISDDDYYNSLLQGHVQIPLLSDASAQDYPHLADALNADAADELETFDGMVDEGLNEVREWYKEMDPENFYGSYYLTRDVTVKRADSRVLSIFLYETQYAGGAHGIYGNIPLNYDAQTGDRLKLEDVLASTDGFNDLVKAELEKKYADETDMFFGLDESLSHYTTGDVPEDQDVTDEDYTYSYTWALDHEGLELYFGPYELAAYAAGDQTVVLKYDDHPELFEQKYLPEDHDVGYIEFFDRYTGRFDVDGDGEADQIGLDNIYEDDDYENPTGLSVYLNDETVELTMQDGPAIPDEAGGYYVHTSDGRNLLYVISPSYSDYVDMIFFDISDGKLDLIGYDCKPSFFISDDEDGMSYTRFILYDPDDMQFSDRFDVITTFQGFKSYHVGSDGRPETDDEVYSIYRTGGWEPVTAAASFEAECIDGDTPENITIDAGETFEFAATDGKTYVDARISDGRMVRLYFEGSGMDVKINGRNAQDLFRDLMYSG
ncbi:MAG: DUF3298 and DUF4163 domain-containing protein [Lachnospiraceae bacterium]|nr:DUF3298 and DUF4163 domain-containing protein [Lachnospiraceae bacterium]